MRTVLTITCSCVSKVHLNSSGQVTKAFLPYYVLSCVHFMPSDLRATVHAGQSKMATCVPATRARVVLVRGKLKVTQAVVIAHFELNQPLSSCAETRC